MLEIAKNQKETLQYLILGESSCSILDKKNGQIPFIFYKNIFQFFSRFFWHFTNDVLLHRIKKHPAAPAHHCILHFIN
jgi:hypothetical protein